VNTFNKEFIQILNAALTKKSVRISSNFDWDRAVNIAEKHNIGSLVYYGALNCNISKNEKYMQDLHHLMLQASVVSIRQMYEVEQVQKAFDNEGIEYLPLKGIILKEVYPRPEMRAMGDADILIKLDQYPKIEKIMTDLGFMFQYESDHELVWEKPTLFLELHKSIMTSYNTDFYSYFGSGWKIAKRLEDRCKYEMSVEDFYIFTFVHFTKHYRISGIGIKHLVDLWVYSTAHSEMKWSYIEAELEKMRLSKFHQNIRKTLGVWFCGDADSEITNLITSVVFNSGQYGSSEMAIVNRALQNGTGSSWKIKLNRICHSIFLPLKQMKERYRILQFAPILLPFMWVFRCFEVFFRHKKRLNFYLSSMNHIDSTKVEENKQALQFVGLDFDDRN